MIKIFLVDEHSLVRAGIRYIIASAEDIEVVGEAESIRLAIPDIERVSPDVLLLDLSGIDEGVSAILENVAAVSPECRILGLSGLIDEEIYESAIRQGARGVVMTYETEATLLKAIRKVHDGEAWINRKVAGRILKQFDPNNTDSNEMRILSLTAGELRIIRLVTEGLGNREIANKLSLAEKTVRNHLTVIYSKLHLSSRLELAMFASQRKIN
ncbi:MAG: response regulator transcription factor [Pyrinomonadaceae bacterium]